MQEIKNVPVGIQSFSAIRRGNCVYVDKTEFIDKLEIEGSAYFLTRPRRFGKSLFVSMLQAYFEGRRELFKGLSIERIKAERGEAWQTYPVLKLDLNSKAYTEKEHLNTILKDHIDEWQKDYNIKVYSPDPDSAFAKIIRQLYEKYNQKVVILVDEYDKPLIATLENLELNDYYRTVLKAFYSVIKSSNDYIHLSFLTGITKFSKVSVFSDLNNLYDLSFDRAYSSICGITQEELEENFSAHIEELAKVYNVSRKEMVARLKQKYDGYHFSEAMIDIYNPFSLCYAFREKKLGDYWFESGTPTFMIRILEQKAFKIHELEKSIKMSIRNIDEYRIDYANLAPLLFQAGYITIKDYDEGLNRYKLGFPNDEVKYAFMGRLMDVYISAARGYSGEFFIDEFLEGMRAGDIDGVLTLIKALMASIPYDSLPEDRLFLREHNYQTAIYLIFTLMGQYVRAEVHGSKGRSDVEVETAEGIYIFEFKVGGLPENAIKQIKESGYAKKHEASAKSVYLIGVAIDENERTLGEWQIEKVK